MSKPGLVDSAMRLAGRSGDLNGGSCTFVPMLAVADVGGDQFGMLPEGSICLNSVHAEGIVVLEVNNSEPQGCASLCQSCYAPACALLKCWGEVQSGG